MKTYEELIQYSTFEDRLKYLQTFSKIGDITFGSHRYISQNFYKSKEWKRLRNSIILRDKGCDLGLDGFELDGTTVHVHHINPITIKDFQNNLELILDPNNLITVSLKTHNLIHYNSDKNYNWLYKERIKNDTLLW